MDVGYQTIIWGHWIQDLDRILKVISEAGYSGVEFAQPTDQLGDPEEFNKLLQKYELTLLGLAGGSLWDRANFARRVPPLYLYVEGWNPALAPAIAKEFTLALHPHVYTGTHCLADTLQLLQEHQELRWIPDTAHLWLVNDSPVRALEVAWDRVIAVHLKDWTPEYGRSCHRYARGFTELGKGCVDLDSVVARIRKPDFGSRWLIVEQDQTSTSPSTSACECAEWLQSQGISLRKIPARVAMSEGHYSALSGKLQHYDTAKETSFLHSALNASTLKMEAAYRTLALAFSRLVDCHLVALWAFNPRDEALSLLATEPPDASIGQYVKISDNLTAIAVERQAVTEFDLDLERPGEPYGYPNATFRLSSIKDQYGARRMVTVPLLNPYNANHVRAIVSLFPKEPVPTQALQDLFRLGMSAARAIDTALDELCAYASGSASQVAGKCKLLGDFQNAIVKLIQSSIGAEGCSLFLVDQTGRHLQLAATTGIEWSVPVEQRSYLKDEGLTGSVWARHDTLLTVDAKSEKARVPKSGEIVLNAEHDACLFLPLTAPSGEVIGVVRCRNNRNDPSGMFSYNDAAVVAAISQVVATHLHILLSEQRRAQAVLRLTHELQNPAVTIRGASDRMMARLKRQGLDPATFFTYDYLSDVNCWSELILSLINNAQFYGLKSEPVRLRPKKTPLIEVVAPATRQMRVLIRREKLPADSSIRYSAGFSTIPALMVDKRQMYQVFFNILWNAIKYSKDGEPVRAEIDVASRDNAYEIYFRDEGLGIDPAYALAIFDEGVRGRTAHLKHVTGQGLGLWVVRQIIEAHHGRVEVTHFSDPTELTIRLPLLLARSKADLMTDVVEPALSLIDEALRRSSLSRGRIDFSGLSCLPELWVEAEAFVELFYELLSNCVAYALSDKSAFNVTWQAEVQSDGLLIHVRDTGIGIDPRYASEIFLPGARRPRPSDPLVAGQGMGLTKSRSIVERHGGWIRCTKTSQPTEFTIWLPPEIGHDPFS